MNSSKYKNFRGCLSISLVMLACICGGSSAKLLCYEGFSVSQSPLANQGSGWGWSGNWYESLNGDNLSGASVFVVDTAQSLQTHAVYTGGLVGYTFTEPLITGGGSIAQPVGTTGTAFRSLAESCRLDMNKNQNYYISFSYRRNNTSNTNTAEWSYFDLLAAKAGGEVRVASIKNYSNEFWAVDMHNISAVQASTAELELNKTYFVAVKIVAMDDSSPQNFDRIYLKVYDLNTPVETADIGFDDEYWTLIGSSSVNSSEIINAVGIAGGKNSGLCIDEIRIATAWKEIVSPQPDDCGDFPDSYKRADINQDCYVDIVDFMQFAKEWVECSDNTLYECMRN